MVNPSGTYEGDSVMLWEWLSVSKLRAAWANK